MDSNNEINLTNQKAQNPFATRTNFFISVAYLCFQVLIPGLVLFFLTSRDFTFSYVLPFWTMVLLSFGLIVVASLLTFMTYKLKFHQIDQFTYVNAFAWLIIGFYLSSYWLDYNYFLVRFIIAFACVIIGIFLTSITLLIFVRKKAIKNIQL